MKKKIRFQTRNREIYEKLNMLNIVDEIVVTNNKSINTILKRIVDLEGEPLNNGKILVKKKNPLQLEVYMM